jgi:uncharacterized protein (TIGR03437 family)
MKRSVLSILLCLVAVTLPAAAQTGIAMESMRAFDDGIQAFMNRWSVPGAALAVAKNGKLIYARGFGMADTAISQPVEPDSLFRIGSVSKTVTAMAVLKLVEEGKLRLDDKVFDILTEYRDEAVDPRAFDITIRHLLSQSSGLTVEEDDIPSASELVAMGVSLPLTQEFFIQEALANPLIFDPGTGYAYLSLNAVLLGKIIERTVHMPYETYMRTQVLGPMGITRMRLAKPFANQRAIGEVHYYDCPGSTLVEPYYPNAGDLVPQPYGGTPMEVLGATGAWIASPIDLVRFATAVDGSRWPRFLKPETVKEMLARSAVWPEDAPGWYGLGWVVQRADGDRIWWHNGLMNGASAYLMRSEAMSLDLAVTFNSASFDEDAFFGDLFSVVAEAIAATPYWPSDDFFPAYYEPSSPRVFAGGLVNAADLQPGPIAPGQLVSLVGAKLGPEAPESAEFDSSGTLKTELAGTRVTFNGIAAALLYASGEQVNAVVPYGVPVTDSIQVVVEHSGSSATPVDARVAPSAPALFPVALNQDWSLNSEQNPAVKGSIITFYGTGAGQMRPETVDGALSLVPFPEIALPVSVTVGGESAEVLYAGAAPLLVSGVFQVNVRIPSEAPSGSVPVVIAIGSAANSSNSAACRIEVASDRKLLPNE